MKCNNCGESLREGYLFCKKCRTPVPKESKLDEKKELFHDKVVGTSTGNDLNNIYNLNFKQTSRNKKIGIIMAMVTVGIIIFFVCNEQMKKGNVDIENNYTNNASKDNPLEEDEFLDNEEENLMNLGEQSSSEYIINVDEQVLTIREIYNDIVSSINEQRYTKKQINNEISAYFDGENIKAIVVIDIENDEYARSYYYDKDKLIFAYYELKDAHRFYFNEEQLMRWRYSKDALDAQNAVNYDLEKTDEYLGWEYTVLEESSMLKNRISSIIKTQFDMTNITYVSATSSLSEYNMTHSPERVVDGDISTAWVEGVEGQGIEEMLTLYFDSEYMISKVIINAGYQKNSEIYEKNSRPKELKISFSDGSSQVYVLKDINDKQEIILEKAIVTKYVSFIIESVYQGNKYEDTVISEIALY